MTDKGDESRRSVVLEAAVENTNEAFVTINSHHEVIFFNKAAERIFGYDRGEVMGHDLNRIMTPTCSRNHREAVARYVSTRIPRRIGHDTEILATRKNGETFPASISFSVSGADGETYFTGIVRDLTEIKALQDRIIQSERLAALGQFVAEISHEIKNPLMMIGGFARQLANEIGDDKARSKLNIIVTEVARLEGLLNEFRDLYSPKNLDMQDLDINALVKEVYDLIRDDCSMKHIQVEFSPGPGDIMVRGDRGKLKQVLLNLTKNATEAMETGGQLSLETRRKEKRVDVIVADNGCGIAEEHRDKIFSPFFTRKKKGTGLGLSVSKGIVDQHPHASLTFESQEGKGTVFTLSMPLYLR
ncbi:MAG: Histidine kinase [Thermodesulfobacteriota bacterium]|nr:Histidine kinase [Thermodesulfobacteriota bacterium]